MGKYAVCKSRQPRQWKKKNVYRVFAVICVICTPSPFGLYDYQWVSNIRSPINKPQTRLITCVSMFYAIIICQNIYVIYCPISYVKTPSKCECDGTHKTPRYSFTTNMSVLGDLQPVGLAL